MLALGNCVADWVADTVVTRAGKPEMAFASCFGSPLLSHVLGLSIAMIVSGGRVAIGSWKKMRRGKEREEGKGKGKERGEGGEGGGGEREGDFIHRKREASFFQVKIGVFNHGQPYRFNVHSTAYSQVKLSWIFLGISLLATAIVFPIFKFSPPR